jgi:iron complex outermembrane receptor protein
MDRHIITALCVACYGAFAAPTNTTENTARVVVTATRTPTSIRSVAKNPTVITAQDIQDGHYSSIPESLQKKAGVFVSNTSDNPAQAKVNLRGFGGDFPHGKTLVLLNGRRLNRPDAATLNWAQIPMQAVERIEVIRGPNSVLYGDHAVGGVINIITKEPSEVPQTTLSASIASYETYVQSLTTSGNLNGLGYVAALGHQSGDGYRDRSAYDTLSGSLRLSGDINESLSAYAEVSVVKEQHQLPGSLSAVQVAQNRKQANNPADAAREESITLQAGIQALLSDELIFNLDAGFSQKDIEADFPSYAFPAWGILPVYYDYKIDTYTLAPKLTLLSPLAEMNNEWVVGIDLSREELATKKYNNNARTTLNTDTKITKTTIGGYIADTLSLTDKLLLSGGFRMEKNKVTASHQGGFSPFDDGKEQTEKAWQAALTWLPTDTLKVFAGIGRTYRYPFVDEQAIYTGWGDGFNQNLEPETGINYELGVEYMPISNLALQATVFRTDMEDEIAWDGGVNQNINLDKTTHRGVELSASYTHEHFALDAYYTWMQSEFTDGANKGNEIPWVPQNQFDLNLALFLTDAMTLNTHMSYIGSMFQSSDNANTGANKQSEYVLVDLLLQYKLPADKTEATVFAGVDNVFGTGYNYLVSWGGYYPAPERTFKAGLSVTF